MFPPYFYFPFRESVIFNDFRATARSISTRKGSNMVCWKAMEQKMTVDDSMAYWIPSKRRMARLRGVVFGILVRRRQKWACRLAYLLLLPQI